MIISKLKIDTRVRSLKSYLEDFELGKIKIPSFQRDFLWSHDQIKQLFDSIKNSYPIGFIQFWKPLENGAKWLPPIEKTPIGPYYFIGNTNNTEPVYILDGLQRFSSLFGCLTNPEKYNKENLKLDPKLWAEKFNLYYDLDEEKFIYLRQKAKNQPYQIPVYIFVNSADFRQYSRKNFTQIHDEKKIELYLDRADALGRIFNDYQIASVDVNYASVEEAVEIFKRVNSTGLEMSKDWIVSALTNKDGFRLASEIDNLIEDLKPYSFDSIKRDILFQCIQNSFGKIYFDYEIEDLARRADFAEVTKTTILSIKNAVRFLYEDLLVLDNKLLPYNSQLIFITSFFNSLGDRKPTEKQILTLKNWFWVTTYCNYFTIYSLSTQRKAYDQFAAFIADENINPVYNDRGDEKFSAQDFPAKINMGSVRAKALALFLINYSMGISSITLEKIEMESIEHFGIRNLFPIAQKDNPTENFMPVIRIKPIVPTLGNSGKKNYANSLTFNGRIPTTYYFLLEEHKGYPSLFITEEMKEIYNKGKESDNYADWKELENKILALRKDLIMNAERQFIESLDIDYPKQ